MALTITSRDLMEMNKTLEHPRVHYFKKMKELLPFFPKSKIAISEFTKKNTWPTYNLIDWRGRIIASITTSKTSDDCYITSYAIFLTGHYEVSFT